MELLEAINVDIQALKKLSGSNDISGRLVISERLAINSYYMASLVGEAYEEKNSAEYYWKSSVNSHVASSTGATGRAEIVAKETYKDMFKSYQDADSKYRRISLLMNQLTVLLETERQNLSYLKQEMRHANA